MTCLCHLTVCKACFVTSQPVTPVSSSVLLYVLSLKLRHFRKEKVCFFEVFNVAGRVENYGSYSSRTLLF